VVVRVQAVDPAQVVDPAQALDPARVVLDRALLVRAIGRAQARVPAAAVQIGQAAAADPRKDS